MELDEFVCEHNLERFRRLANLLTSAAERQAILEVLAEEVAKLKSVHKGPAAGSESYSSAQLKAVRRSVAHSDQNPI
jgi:hypothetical protein